MATETLPAPAIGAVERALIQGDLSKLTPEERQSYYLRVCESLGLNPLTKPFDYITLNGKLVLYPKRDCTDQLRSIHGVSVAIVSRDRLDDVYIVTARATLPTGRADESTGVVTLGNLRGDALANALMKAETKAKRRVTLSICGLGLTDESELDTIPAVVQQTPPQATPQATPPALPAPNDNEPCGRKMVDRLLALCEQKGVALRDEMAPYLSPHDSSDKLTRAQAIAIGTRLKALPDAEARPPLPPTSEDLRREPKTAAELSRWLAAFEARLVVEKACVAGELLTYVNRIGEQDGLPDTLAEWPPAAISAAVECVRDWAAQQRAAAKGGAA